ncbi:MAG: shikimate kinase [Coriobacteriia bacterium]|nr:shikimate kinase [Coriobacteriia bacterium]
MTTGESRGASAQGAAPEAIQLGPLRAARKPRYQLTRPVFFVGFMGAGKTSVSRKLARMLGLVSIDVDTYIERREERKVSQIFADEGEAGFRRIEAQVLRELAGREPALIGCGGGVVTTPENRQVLKECGTVVFLYVTADEARGRISDLSTRPLFNEIEEARARNAARLPLYQEVATITVDTAGKSVSTIAREVRQALIKEGTLCALPR